ncbi:PASTA domain-containing protein [Streptomyces sp. NPDC005574]|uniref:PASTA domain-containing protein n=1 Tax=Streptomyces sp. NPDC005574 TaxID=3156891 RepID=UPI0033BE0642
MHHVRPRPCLVRRAALAITALLLTCGPLTACQGNDDDAPAPAPTTVATSPTTDGKASPTAAQGIVPDLTGLTVADARGRLAELDYGMAFTDDSQIGDDSLKVTAQSPAPGAALKTGATVTLTVPGR